MNAVLPKSVRDRLILQAETAAELMTANPISLDQGLSLREAAAILTDREIGAAPVIDEAGRPVGVLSRTDLVRHERERAHAVPRSSDFYQHAELHFPDGERLPDGFQVEEVDQTTVGEVMTPTVIGVAPETPAMEVVAEMLALKVHRLFVLDDDGVLIGVISAFDVLRNLRKA